MDNLVIYNARIVTPIGHTALKGKDMSNLHIIENGTILVEDGIITYVGQDIEHQCRTLTEVLTYDAGGRCVLPGFVDSHTHFVFGGERAEEFSWRLKGESYMSIMKRGGGIASTVKATRALNKDVMYSRAQQMLNRMSRMGVTTVEGKSGYGLDMATELNQLSVMKELDNQANKKVDVASTYLGAHAVPLEYKGKPDYYIDFMIESMLHRIYDDKLATFCDVFCEDGVFTVEQSRRLLTAAKRIGFKLKIHADEIVSYGGAELAAELGAVSADHLLCASNKGIKAMAEQNVVATLLPLTAFALKGSYARGRDMIDSGCAVALATDLNPGSCFSGSIPLTFALACINMGLSIEEAITAMTLNGAAAIDRADTIGSIEVGKKADFVILNSSDYNCIPYYVGMNSVSEVIKEGRIYEVDDIQSDNLIG
jgi:imidazolonepropionase